MLKLADYKFASAVAYFETDQEFPDSDVFKRLLACYDYACGKSIRACGVAVKSPWKEKSERKMATKEANHWMSVRQTLETLLQALHAWEDMSGHDMKNGLDHQAES